VRSIKTGKYHKVPAMIGHTEQELSYSCANYPSGEYGTSEEFFKNLPITLKDIYRDIATNDNIDDMAENVIQFFPSSMCNNTKKFACCALLDNLINDFIVRCPARRLLKALRNNEDQPEVFLFNFDQPLSCPPELKINGSNYLSDIPWVFGSERSHYLSTKVANCSWTQSERDFSKNISSLWQQFANSSSPTLDKSWAPYDRPNFYYQNLAIESGFYLGEFLRPDSWCDFWDSMDALLVDRSFPDDNTKTIEIENEDKIPRGVLTMVFWIGIILLVMFCLFGFACSLFVTMACGCGTKKNDLILDQDSDNKEMNYVV